MGGGGINLNARAVENKFRRGSKSYIVARWMVQQNRDILDLERDSIATEFGLARNTVNEIVNRLRGLGCYGDIDLTQPESTHTIHWKYCPTPNIPSTQRPIPGNPIQPKSARVNPSHHTSSIDSSPPTSQDSATREDFELLQKAVTNSPRALSHSPDEIESQDS